MLPSATATNAEPVSKINQLWQKLKGYEADNQKLKRDLAALERLYIEQLYPVERDVWLPAVEQFIVHLTRFVDKKSLPQWAREELIDWLHQLIAPIARLDEGVWQALSQNFNQTLMRFYGIEHDADVTDDFCEQDQRDGVKLEYLFEQFNQAVSDAKTEDEFEQAFYQLIKNIEQANLTINNLDAWLADLYHEMSQAWQQRLEDDDDEQSQDWDHDWFDTEPDTDSRASANSSENASNNEHLNTEAWLKTTFRKLTQLLHPDREPDEQLKQYKQQQLARLTAARDEQDIFTILQIYFEAKKQSNPREERQEDVQQLQQLLLREIDQLDQSRARIVNQNPLSDWLYYSVYQNNLARSQKNLIELGHKLNQEAENFLVLTDFIRNLTVLKSVLSERTLDRY